MFIRRYQPFDAEAIAKLYQNSVRGIGASAYDPRQIEIWASYPEDLDEFRELLSQGTTLVAIANDQYAAFGQLNPLDHIAFIYTATAFSRRGYASQIYDELEVEAIAQGTTRLNTEASRISKHFFLKKGFEIVETELAERKGVTFERFKMEKILAGTAKDH